MIEKGYVPKRGPFVSEGGVHILPPLKKEEVGKPLTSEEWPIIATERKEFPQDILDGMIKEAENPSG